MVRMATTFGGSEFSRDSAEYKDAVLLGRTLAKLDYIVKCGGYYGLMEAIAKGISLENGQCIGITNASFDPKQANSFISLEIKCKDLFDRLRELIKDSELFIVQYGSLGTLTELFLVWCLCYTNTIQDKKIYLIGEDWYNIINTLHKLPIKEKEFGLIRIFPNTLELINLLEN